MNETTFPLKRRNSKMRSSIRYGLVAVGALALMIGTFIALRPRLEQKVQAQTFNTNQVAACDVTSAPSKTNDCLVISAFRENRSEEHTSELQSHSDLVCRLLLEKKKLRHATAGEEKITDVKADNQFGGNNTLK